MRALRFFGLVDGLIRVRFRDSCRGRVQSIALPPSEPFGADLKVGPTSRAPVIYHFDIPQSQLLLLRNRAGISSIDRAYIFTGHCLRSE